MRWPIPNALAASGALKAKWSGALSEFDVSGVIVQSLFRPPLVLLYRPYPADRASEPVGLYGGPTQGTVRPC